jgi:hypothetical protein
MFLFFLEEVIHMFVAFGSDSGCSEYADDSEGGGRGVIKSTVEFGSFCEYKFLHMF